ncbi:hypothetical protein TNCV_1769421 [Trichonephila clavipes]|nr:hypothetical protein TNCV_1769421 [Trichonephila clavipes]
MTSERANRDGRPRDHVSLRSSDEDNVCELENLSKNFYTIPFECIETLFHRTKNILNVIDSKSAPLENHESRTPDHDNKRILIIRIVLNLSFTEGASISKTPNRIEFSKAATSKAFKSRNRNPEFFSRRHNCGSNTIFQQNMGSTLFQLTQIVNQYFFSTDFSSNHADDRNAYSSACQEIFHFCPKCKSSFEFWERRHFTSEDWKLVMWSDESRYIFFALMENVEFGEKPTKP